MLVFPPEDLSAITTTRINHYTYRWPWRDAHTGGETTTQALALGIGSIFNHSRNQNVGFCLNVEQETITYTTIRDIEAGEELCLSYGPRLWFDDVDGDEDLAEPQETAEDVLGCFELEEDMTH